MSRRRHTEHAEVRAAEDLAWNLKDEIGRLNERALTNADRTALAAIGRDIARVHQQVTALVGRKRVNKAPAAATPDAGEQTELGT